MSFITYRVQVCYEIASSPLASSTSNLQTCRQPVVEVCLGLSEDMLLSRMHSDINFMIQGNTSAADVMELASFWLCIT